MLVIGDKEVKDDFMAFYRKTGKVPLTQMGMPISSFEEIKTLAIPGEVSQSQLIHKFGS